MLMSGVPHAHVECTPCSCRVCPMLMSSVPHARGRKYSFQMECKIFSEGHCYVLAW